MSRPLALVTGVTGFVAGHCAIDLLDHGFDVRGTVRDLSRAPVDHLRAAAQRTGGRLELVPASLLEDPGWDAAVDGVEVVEHVASPAPKYRPRDEEELIRPAVDGTLRVLRAAGRAGVRRVALTSSVEAVRSGHDMSDGRECTEDDWSVVERCEPYARSKTLAERAAWAEAERLGLELVVLNPGLILGPVHGPEVNVSVDVVRQLLTRQLPALPRLGFAPVDVRDVAAAHRLALQTPEAAGRRYILATEAIWLADIARTLAREYNPRGFRVPQRPIPSWTVRLGSRINPALRLALPLLDTPARTSSARARAELGWNTRDVRTTIVETAESLIASGAVPGR
ncbi:cinnamoyl-CoA reductase [Parafrankia colletiae]|uniref:Cinnamoyl-CoA reductase n=1 Tax=Parafrankia colletiae TaxID=573497 RepID=A0A1S1Q7V1_9ACTN|nr:NAD-dependent epimerase/dehydratase family protein [Parafrankia colletiae]MCK9903106.1 NAD-dependent epimerase/dehydratase family protein [Frankia sp. Cpl3]OHV30968.1 cinnamoyl-CoA reductase [Parafrankia colletiae]